MKDKLIKRIEQSRKPSRPNEELFHIPASPEEVTAMAILSLIPSVPAILLVCVCPLGLAHFAHLIWPTLSY